MAVLGFYRIVKTPPLPEFRAYCLMAEARKNKVHPLVNLSSPKGGSFNDNIEPSEVMKVTMSWPPARAQE
jgi:hypothetical protein